MSDSMNAEAHTTIIILDDLPFRRACIAHMLSPYFAANGFQVSASAIADFSVDDAGSGIVLLVIGSDTDALRTISETSSRISHTSGKSLAVLSTMESTPELARIAFENGASAFLTSDMDPALVLRALDLVAAGGSFCSPSAVGSSSLTSPSRPDGQTIEAEATNRQQEVMRHLREGLSNKTIARRMMISEATVKIHIRHIMRKIGVHNRTQVALHVANSEAYGAKSF
jgi:two-component system nitrate/nitrite response regulator NarL